MNNVKSMCFLIVKLRLCDFVPVLKKTWNLKKWTRQFSQDFLFEPDLIATGSIFVCVSGATPVDK